MNTLLKKFLPLILFTLTPFFALHSQGQVYLVLGSDTGIWDGLGMSTFHDHYRFDLYTDPQRNAYKVMDPSFRDQITDSYGNTLKLTWWIMGGNTFRYGTNNNVPLDNTMVLYLMKKYHDDMINHWGDEVTLHYHDWIWSDYNGDGQYFWNQSTDFSQFKEDFDLTLAQYLIEENVFPVSFRSGWHYMNNEWQNYLNTIIPYSLHDDYPNVRIDTVEPLDNIYDWSKSSSEFVPFHPSTQNYQLPGDGKGWDNRSIYMANMDTTLMTHVFSQAQNGIDQVVCLWAHLPEDNYLDNITRINQIVHQIAAKFPNVKFRYCTAVEAMQRWRNAYGEAKPNLSFTSEQNSDKVDFVIRTDKPIFQAQPFVVVKDINENYKIVPCYSIGTNEWKTSDSFNKSDLAKAGVAVTDTVGNLSTAFINFLPNDIYIDNDSSGYSEVKGNWTTSANTAWDLDSRQAVLAQNDTAITRWSPNITYTGHYNVFVQVPAVSNPVDHLVFKIYSDNKVVDSTVFNSSVTPNQWIYLNTPILNAGVDNHIDMISLSGNETGKIAEADVIKITALVPERKLSIPQNLIDFGMVSQDDSASFNLTLSNGGSQNLTITGLNVLNYNITSRQSFPFTIPAMSSATVPLIFHASALAKVSDTLYVLSDDSLQNKISIPFLADVQPYFCIVDNSDSLHYTEQGQWNYSTAQAYGPNSRFAYLHQSPPASASFSAKVNRSGVYNIKEIVPTTVNSSKDAIYVFSVSGVPVDSFYVDQNNDSGNWVTIGRSFIPANVPVELKVIDSGENTPNVVLRADAVMFSIVKEVTNVNNFDSQSIPKKFVLAQNYPNPFNPSTTISYSLPKDEYTTLIIYDVLGREVKSLVNDFQKAGTYRIHFTASELASGIYFYKLAAGNFISTKKMVLLK